MTGEPTGAMLKIAAATRALRASAHAMADDATEEERAMTSLPMRDPGLDHLLTPKNAALAIIDFQPIQVGSIKSMDRELLVHNVVKLTRTAILYDLPIVVSTVNVKTGANEPTIPELQAILPSIDTV